MRCVRSARLLSLCALQRGASLIEVLVAAVLLSTGVAGMVGLLHRGGSFNHAAYLRSQGTALAADMVDRMRAYAGACAGPDAGAACAFVTDDGQASGGAAGQACGEALPEMPSVAAAAAAEVSQWKSCLSQELPDGRGRVAYLEAGASHVDLCGAVFAATAVPRFVVEVSWAEHRLTSSDRADRECVALHTMAAVGL